MASVNSRSVNPHKTHEGGATYKVSSEKELERTVMSCLLWEDSFYESGVAIAKRVEKLAAVCDSNFVVKLALKTSVQYKLRHIPLLLAVELLKKQGINCHIISNLITRADSITEILSLYWKDGKHPLAKQLKKGLSLAFTKFDEYQLAKYNRNKVIKLKDVLKMVHPIPENKSQSDLWNRLLKDELKTPDTWEVALSSGKDKKATFTRLLRENNLGDLAFLRNLRNMVESGVDRDLINDSFKNREWSKILPYQFIASAKYAPSFERQLDSAMQKALKSMERLDGSTALLIDVSGSMNDPLSSKSELTRWDSAVALAMLLEGVCDDLRVFEFNNTCREVPARKGFGLKSVISKPSGGTYLWNSIRSLTGKYKRVIIITDEQTSDSGSFENNGTQYYLLNVGSYQNGIGYQKNSVHISGFSEASIRYITEFEKNNR